MTTSSRRKAVDIATQTKRVRDLVHRDIALTPIEQSVIDRPEFQRLRHVRQQSFAYYSFPSNHTCRFSHSLGAMHLSGLLFKRAIENTSPTTLDAILHDASHVISRLTQSNIAQLPIGRTWQKKDADILEFDSYLQALRIIIGTPLGINHRPPREIASVSRELSDTERLILNAMWQATRLATLLHDIGHLPASHLFEDAIKDVGGPDGRSTQVSQAIRRMQSHHAKLVKHRLGRYGHSPTTIRGVASPDIHEQLGLIISSEFEITEEWTAPAYMVTLAIAQQILASPSPAVLSLARSQMLKRHPMTAAQEASHGSQRLLSFLHSIVSSEIDADRLDYCLRDPSAAAVDGSSLDALSLLNNSCVVAVVPPESTPSTPLFPDFASGNSPLMSDIPTTSAVYCMAYHSRAANAIEGFFFSRFHSFRQIAHDHNSARFYILYKMLISQLLEIAFDTSIINSHPDYRIKQVLEDDGWVSRRPKSNKPALPMLDPEQIVRYDDAWLRTSLSNVLRRIQCMRSGEKSEADLKIELLCDICLNRNIGSVASIFKTETDVQDEAREVLRSVCLARPPKITGDTRNLWEDLAKLAVTSLMLGSNVDLVALSDRISDGLNRDATIRSARQSKHHPNDMMLAIAHRVPHKSPRSINSRSLPEVLIRASSITIRNDMRFHNVANVCSVSPLMDALAMWQIPSHLKVTLIGHQIRSRDGQTSTVVIDHARAIIRQELANFANQMLWSGIRPLLIQFCKYSRKTPQSYAKLYGQPMPRTVGEHLRDSYPFSHHLVRPSYASPRIVNNLLAAWARPSKISLVST